MLTTMLSRQPGCVHSIRNPHSAFRNPHGGQGKVQVLNESAKNALKCEQHPNWVIEADIHPDGRTLATANAASTAAQPAIPTETTSPLPAATATTMPTATPEPLSDAKLGELVFKTRFLETSGRHCGYCHNTNEAESERVSLIGIASTAGERVEGLSAEEYIRQSILEPAAYLVEGKNPDSMPRIYGDILSEDDINHLIAYLMSLE